MLINKKNMMWSVITLCLLLIGTVSCTKEINASQTIMRDGLLYETGTRQPFSGTVLGKSRREDYRTFPVTFKKEYKNGRLHGKSYFWYENGKIESVEPYQNGLINGAVTRYYENGKRKARIHFTEGMRGGNMGENFWDINGKKIKG